MLRRCEHRGIEPLVGGLRTVVGIAVLIGALSVIGEDGERCAGLQRQHRVHGPAAHEWISFGKGQIICAGDRDAMPDIAVSRCFVEVQIAPFAKLSAVRI